MLLKKLLLNIFSLLISLWNPLGGPEGTWVSTPLQTVEVLSRCGPVEVISPKITDAVSIFFMEQLKLKSK